MKLDPTHINAASKHERDLILHWLTDIGADPKRVAWFELDGDAVVAMEFVRGVDGELVLDEDGEPQVREVVYAAGPLCPRATIATLVDRLDDGVVSVPDDEDYVARPALGRTHPYGSGAW